MSKILLAISDQWVVDPRTDALAEWARRLDADILAVHVIFGGDESATAKHPGEKILEELDVKLKAAGARVETLVLFANDIVSALLRVPEERHATVIVLGLANKGMLARLIEGNIPQAIINATRVPVLCLPPDWDGVL